MAHGVLIYAEHRDGELTNGTWEAIAAGQAIAAAAGTDARAVIIGSNLADNASRIAAKALAEVITVEHDKLATYTPDGFTAALAQTITSVDPEWVVFSHTYHVRDFAPRVAARLDRVLIGDVIKFKSEGGITLVRQIFQGKINADVTCATAAPRMISFQAGSYRTDAAKDGAAPAPVRAHAVDLGAVEIRWTTEERFKEVKGAVDLTAAPRIVSVGRGIKGEENLGLVRELAEALDAELAASRPICDNGWLPMDRQIGSSGQTVAPQLYMAVGISGAIQHVVGMKNASTIVAINKDKEAPIFDLADFGVVGDLFEIVPALVKKLKE
ncbi:MAG TPA: electron transfer flavoprotein subunit alpha/FixB family protein [Blastocatellia bacterium]|nr:electron transfer flavoprotein subunit alpha/FixB family protein [Blastocatellia bacterium]